MKPLVKLQVRTFFLVSILPCLSVAAVQANGFDYRVSPDWPNRVLLQSNLSFDGAPLTYGHLYLSTYELTDMDGDELPERAFMLTEPGISCLTLVYVPSTQLWNGDIHSSDLSAFARVRNIGYPYFSSSDAACQLSETSLQSAEVDLHVESIADISGDGKRDFLINDFEFVPTILVSGDLVPGVVYDAADTDSRIATHMTTGYIQTVLEDIDQDGLGEIAMAWNPDTDMVQTNPSIADCAIYAGGIGNFPQAVSRQTFTAEQTLYLQAEESCSYVQNIGDVNGDQVQDLLIEDSSPDGYGSISWIIHGGSYLQSADSLMLSAYRQSGNAYPLQFPTASGGLTSLQTRGIGDFDADGYDDVLTIKLQNFMDLLLTAPGTGFFNNSALILYGSADGLPRDLGPNALTAERASQIMHFGRLQKFADVNDDGAADLTTDFPFSVYLGTPGHRYAFLLPGGTEPRDAYQLQAYKYGVNFGELIWNVSRKFVLLWQDDELVARTEANSLMIPRDIDHGGMFYITPDFLGQDAGYPLLASSIREPLPRSNTVTLLADDGCNAEGDTASEVIQPQATGLTISWAPVCTGTINVHGGAGQYITTLPGDAIEWTAVDTGNYFLVSTNSGSWTTWQRSAIVSLSSSQ